MKDLKNNNIEYREDSVGYIYYFDKITGKLQKEDPDLTKFLHFINETYECSKYSLYRCAQKIHLLKKMLLTENVPYPMVKSILDHHRMIESDSSPTVKPSKLISVIFDIFYAAEKLKYITKQESTNLQKPCSILANFYWNIFDPNRNLSISLLELKLTLVLLCYIPSFEEITLEIFKLLADHNRCVSRLRFDTMLKIITKILNYLQETDFDFSSIVKIVRVSFENSPGIVGLNDYQFISLWKSSKNYLEPYSNVIHLAFRIKESDSISHENIKCICCNIRPIQGLRFKCQRCKNYSLCLKCFSSGFTTKNHSISHRMFEISSTKEKSNQIVSFISKLCNIFTFSSSTMTPQSNSLYPLTTLTESNANENHEMELKSMTSNTLHDFDPTSGSIIHKRNQSTCGKITSIIQKLMDENKKIANYLNFDNLTSQTIEDHIKCINEQIDQLKLLQTHTMAFILPHSSTPLRLPNKMATKAPHQLSTLSKSIYGAEINKSYVEENRSDFSIRELSTWYANRNSFIRTKHSNSRGQSDSFNIEFQMSSFKFLLNKVKDIVDDSYSDNIELSKATNELEKVLDEIIRDAEKKI